MMWVETWRVGRRRRRPRGPRRRRDEICEVVLNDDNGVRGYGQSDGCVDVVDGKESKMGNGSRGVTVTRRVPGATWLCPPAAAFAVVVDASNPVDPVGRHSPNGQHTEPLYLPFLLTNRAGSCISNTTARSGTMTSSRTTRKTNAYIAYRPA